MPRRSAARPAPSLLQLTEIFPKKKVVVVGDLIADHYVYGQTDRISREAPVLIVRHEYSEVKAGGAANAAANVRSLMGQVVAIGFLGEDDMGEHLAALFSERGIDLVSVRPRGYQTETKMRVLAGGINTTRQQMLRVDRTSSEAVAPNARAELARRLGEATEGADAVLVSDYGAGAICEETRRVLRKLAAQGVPVCVDSRFGLESLGGLTLYKPNEPELQALTGVELRTEGDLLRAGLLARKRLKARYLVVTRGRNGMAIFDDRASVELLPVHGQEEAVDVTGAGDTVIATLTLALAAGATLNQAAHLANVAGAVVVRKPGTAVVARDEIRAELKRAR